MAANSFTMLVSKKSNIHKKNVTTFRFLAGEKNASIQRRTSKRYDVIPLPFAMWAKSSVILPHMAAGCSPIPANLQLGKDDGQPLPDAVKTQMEELFQEDFSSVRIHVGDEASSINALAFTWGDHIYFQPQEYAPETSRGINILGHELTHVVQQRAGKAQSPNGKTVILWDEDLENEADYYGNLAEKKFFGGGLHTKQVLQTKRLFSLMY